MLLVDFWVSMVSFSGCTVVYLWGHLREHLLSQSQKGKGKVDETQQFTPLESGSLKHIFAQYNNAVLLLLPKHVCRPQRL